MKRKMIALVLLVTFLLLSLVMVIEKMTEERLEAVITHSHEDSVRSFVEQTQAKLSRLRASLLILSNSDLMREAILSPESLLQKNTFNRVTAFYKGVLKYRTDINAVTLSDINNNPIFTIEKVNGKVVIQLSPDREEKRGELSSEEIHFVTDEGLDAEVIVSPLTFSQLSQSQANLLAPKVTMRAAVKDSDGSNIGSVLMDFNASLLLGKLSELTERSMGEAFLIDHSGKFLHSERGTTRVSEYFEQSMSFQDAYPELWNSINSSVGESLPGKKELIYKKKFCIFTDCQSNDVNNPEAIQPWWVLNIYNPADANTQGLMNARWYLLYALIAILLSIAVIILYSARRLITANSSLRKAKEELEAKDKLFNAFMENSPTLVYIKDREGKYKVVNQAYAKHVGMNGKDIVGKTDFELESYDLEKCGHSTNLDHAVLHLGKITTTEEAWYNSTGKAFRFLITRFPISSTDQANPDMLGAIAIDVTEKQQAKAESHQQMALFKTLFNASPDAIFILDSTFRVSLLNKQAEKLFLGQESVLKNKKISDLVEFDGLSETFDADTIHTERQLKEVEDRAELRVLHGKKLDASTFYCEVRFRHTIINDQKMIMCIVRDVSNKVRIEEHIKQSQKMEAIGQLTGGLAHDFNNLLGIVIGNLDMLADQLLKDEKAQKRINSALKASLSGAELTRRLLAFARKQALQPTNVDIKTVFDDLTPILERSLKSDIKLKVRLHEPLYPAYVDVSQLENVIINLAINARDAMPSGGTLSIDAKAVELDALFINLSKEDISPGKYIYITVCDTGHGIPSDIIENIFEPFFTTKEKGKGTGLGLAMAHGFAKQSQGMLQVYSEVGIGTTFHLYLPAAAEVSQSNHLLSGDVSIPQGTETILVVDDEDELADIAQTYLSDLGYSVLKASSAEKALKLMKLKPNIKLILTDIIMPEGMSGIELREKVSELYPEVKVLYASGFSAEAIAVKKGRELQTALIQKPYRKRELGVAVRDCLDT
jgi:PAS domain S-box-containing protein